MAAEITGTIRGTLVGQRLSRKEQEHVRRIRTALIAVAATAHGSDTVAITLTNYGIAADGFLGIRVVRHTTDNSVLVVEAPTTAVVSGVLTVTLGAGNNDKTRSMLIFGTEA